MTKKQDIRLKIQRVDRSLPLPGYQTNGSVAFDMYSRVETSLKPEEVKLVPSNLIIKIPEGFFLLIANRSSTAKKGLMPPHGIGIIDQDYHGQKDEIMMPLYNFSGKNIKIKRGQRLAQGMILPVEKVKWLEVKKITHRSRGGIGSTGLW